MFEGKTINIIKPIGGLVAGQQKTYELWTQGGIVYITSPEDVEAIDEVIKQVIRMNKRNQEYGKIDLCDYLQYMIDEEGILN